MITETGYVMEYSHDVSQSQTCTFRIQDREENASGQARHMGKTCRQEEDGTLHVCARRGI